MLFLDMVMYGVVVGWGYIGWIWGFFFGILVFGVKGNWLVLFVVDGFKEFI